MTIFNSVADRNARIMELLRAGGTYQACADALGIHITTVYTVWKSNREYNEKRVDHRTLRRKPLTECSSPQRERRGHTGPSEQTMDIVARLRAGESMRDVQGLYRISRQRVSQIWERHKLPGEKIVDHRVRTYDEGMVNDIVCRLRSGHKPNNIAKLYGITYRTVMIIKHTRCPEVPTQRVGNFTKSYSDNRFLRYREKIETGEICVADVARELGCHYITALRRYKALNISKKR